jgi:hypothetical protein
MIEPRILAIAAKGGGVEQIDFQEFGKGIRDHGFVREVGQNDSVLEAWVAAEVDSVIPAFDKIVCKVKQPSECKTIDADLSKRFSLWRGQKQKPSESSKMPLRRRKHSRRPAGRVTAFFSSNAATFSPDAAFGQQKLRSILDSYQ